MKGNEGDRSGKIGSCRIYHEMSVNWYGQQHDGYLHHRSDLALVCSPVEVKLLTQVYRVTAEKLQVAPFFVDCQDLKPQADQPGYPERQHFMTIGNFR